MYLLLPPQMGAMLVYMGTKEGGITAQKGQRMEWGQQGREVTKATSQLYRDTLTASQAIWYELTMVSCALQL